jgi:predicted nucleotidyltransferase
MPSNSNIPSLIDFLAEAGVEFVIVGGMAAVVQGVPVTTFDLDIVHNRAAANTKKLLALLKTVHARYRGHPPDKKSELSEAVFLGKGHQLLYTDLGALDVLGAIEDGLEYEDLLAHSIEVKLRGKTVKILTLEKLAELKSRSANEKDRLVFKLIAKTLREKNKL